MQQFMFLLMLFSAATALTASEQPSPRRSKFPEAGSESGARGSAAVLSTTYFVHATIVRSETPGSGMQSCSWGLSVLRYTLGFRVLYRQARFLYFAHDAEQRPAASVLCQHRALSLAVAPAARTMSNYKSRSQSFLTYR